MQIAALLVGPPGSITVQVQVVDVADVVVEDSSATKYLPLRNGALRCNKAVYIVLDGERHEVTVDSPPDYSGV